MTHKINHITLFEHESLRTDRGNQRISDVQLKSLQTHYGEKGVPYYSLIHNGVKFNQFVGVIHVGQLVIEVLPKADARFTDIDEKKEWRDILINMLFAAGEFDILSPSSSSLKVKPNSILDLYFELFINEIESILQRGLVKKYSRQEGNLTSLKGSLIFSKHIQKNLIRRERFYVRHTTYDIEHQLHAILHKTIRLLDKINTNIGLKSRIGALLLHFPEMPDLSITEALFEKLVYSRRTAPYRKAIEISRLLLLKYHPDLSNGKNDVLALMFDMNRLWETFVYKSIQRYKRENTSVTSQTSKFFWKPEAGYRLKMRPDIVINQNHLNCVVLDVKWKNLNGQRPSAIDLRQMYVYSDYYKANKVALIYPGEQTSLTNGNFLDPNSQLETKKSCSIISFKVEPKVKQWQKQIYNALETWWQL